MTEPTDGTTPPPRDRVEAVDLQLEMQRSYLDYAMSVIVARALPEVRDGLKPVHRRVIYAMYDGGYRPDRGYNKCARVVGDVMGNYHPHGDTSIYDTLVRLAQPWAMRYPLVDGQGNFGSPGNDPAAAMRYCVPGHTRVRLADGSDREIAEIAAGMSADSEREIELKVRRLDGANVLASRVFHSGSHPTLRVMTSAGALEGTFNHPVLCLVAIDGEPQLRWKLLEELRRGDHVANVDAACVVDRSALPDGAALTSAVRRLPWSLPVESLGYVTVESVEDAGVQEVYSLRVDSEDHSFLTDGFVSHNTECRMAPLAMEMVRDIDEDTVDFQPNYDGKTEEPVVLPSRFPNLLVNGSAGIAVGMATNIPPHNLREVAAGVQWALDHPDASNEELLEALLARITGPDFPTGALILGRRGIEDAYRTGRGSITMRAVVEVEEIQGRQCLVITELPYQVNPDNLAQKIAELVKDGKIGGIADVRDETSTRTGQRLVIVLKRDAVAKVVLNNLYKHTQLQDNFGANMLALVDGVPRTLTLDAFVRHWVNHQIDVIVRRTQFRLRKAEEQAHILRGLLKALDRIDEVIALIRASESADAARAGLIELLEIDDIQATEILNMQLRRLAALERQQLLDRYDALMRDIEEYQAILASPARQREIVSDELGAIVERFGDERRSRIVPFDGDMSMEDLIPEEPVVVTITRGGYAKRTRVDAYRSQRRGGKGVRGAQLRSDDVVEHFFVTTTHHWVLFFTDQGRVYRAKAYELPEGSREARGQHVANLLAFQPDEQIAQVLTLRDYDVSPYLVLATRHGYVKKTRLSEYDSNRSGGIIAIAFRDPEDSLVSAKLVSSDDDLLLVSRKGQSVRFRADDGQLRPMGRSTGGVTGMRFREGDELLAVAVVRADRDGDAFLVTVTDGGYAKRTAVEEYRVQGRGGTGIKAARLNDERGALVGAFVAGEGDEVLVVMAAGKVVRTPVAEVPPKGRDTMGVILAKPDNGDSIVAVARNPEPIADEEVDQLPTDVAQVPASDDDEVASSSSASVERADETGEPDESGQPDDAGSDDSEGTPE